MFTLGASAVFRLGALWAVVVCCGSARADTLARLFSAVGTNNRVSASTSSLFGGQGNRGSLFSDSSLAGGFFGSRKGDTGFSKSSLSGDFFDTAKSGHGFTRPSFSGGSQGSNNLISGFSGSLHSGGFLGSKQGGISSFSGNGHLGTAVINFQSTIPRGNSNLASNFFSNSQELNSHFENQKLQLFNGGLQNTNSLFVSSNHLSSQPNVLASGGFGFKKSVEQSFQTPSVISAHSHSIVTGKSKDGLLHRQNTRLSSFSGSSSNFGSGSFPSRGISTGLAFQSDIQTSTKHGFGLISGSISKPKLGSGQTSKFSSGVGNRDVISGRASQIPLLPTTTKLVAAGTGFHFVKYPSGFDTGHQKNNPGVGFLPGRAAPSKFVGVGNKGNHFGRIVGAFGSGNTESFHGSAGAGVFGSTKPSSPFAAGNIGTFGTRNTGNRFGSGNIEMFGSRAGNKLGPVIFGGSGTGFSGNIFTSGGANRLGLTQFPSGTLSSNKNLSGTFVGDGKYSG